METEKKVWEEPQLIVLTRGTPEESVLTHCKTIGAIGVFPKIASQNNCNNNSSANCGDCQSRSGS